MNINLCIGHVRAIREYIINHDIPDDLTEAEQLWLTSAIVLLGMLEVGDIANIIEKPEPPQIIRPSLRVVDS